MKLLCERICYFVGMISLIRLQLCTDTTDNGNKGTINLLHIDFSICQMIQRFSHRHPDVILVVEDACQIGKCFLIYRCMWSALLSSSISSTMRTSFKPSCCSIFRFQVSPYYECLSGLFQFDSLPHRFFPALVAVWILLPVKSPTDHKSPFVRVRPCNRDNSIYISACYHRLFFSFLRLLSVSGSFICLKITTAFYWGQCINTEHMYKLNFVTICLKQLFCIEILM